LRHKFLPTDKFYQSAVAAQSGLHPKLQGESRMNANEKINLWLKMGETIGVPKSQIQAVQDNQKGLSDGVYKVTWADRFGADSIEGAAQMALVILYANGDGLRPHRFSLSVEGKDGVVTKVDLSGAKFLAGLQAGLKRCQADAAHSDQQASVESKN
jgi:hypothetical protein